MSKPPRLGVFAFLVLAWLGAAAAQTRSDMPRLYTDEEYIADVSKRSTLKTDDVFSVLDYVLSQLPSEVHVIPTESYYYFYFYNDGVKYAGNFRFDVGERDKGLVKFIYFKATSNRLRDDHDYGTTLGPDNGVTVEKVGEFAYRLTYNDRDVTFLLNDLSGVRPPEGVLGESETFLGPVSDESGIRFFLVFDESLKLFHYVLDETVPVSDELVPTPGMSHLLIGRRTGFAFLADPNRGRKLLVGVYAPNIDANNYLDGPFDQLPDSFLKGDELRSALIVARPELADRQLDRLGISPGGDFREKIAPYVEYDELGQLAPAEICAAEHTGEDLYRCLSAFVSR